MTGDAPSVGGYQPIFSRISGMDRHLLTANSPASERVAGMQHIAQRGDLLLEKSQLNDPKPTFNRDILLSTVCFDPRFPSVGPHEGREAHLMRLGWKPAALFGDVVGQPPTSEEIAVAEMVTSGQLEMMTFTFPEHYASAMPFFIRYACYFPKERRDIALSVRSALSSNTLSRDSPQISLELILGRALGYCDEDIFAFVLKLARYLPCGNDD